MNGPLGRGQSVCAHYFADLRGVEEDDKGWSERQAAALRTRRMKCFVTGSTAQRELDSRRDYV